MGPISTLAYLADGKLFFWDDCGDPRLVESSFVQQLLERAERSRERNQWKDDGIAWRFAANGAMGLPSQPPAETRRVRFTGLARGPAAGQLLYSIDTDYVGGLFLHELADGSERRLLHRNQFCAQDLSLHAPSGALAFSLRSPDGTAHIATISLDGRGLREITEGDCVDEAPSWVPGDARTLLFQSAGVGRNEQGYSVELGPYAIQKLNVDSGELTTLLEAESFDYLLPRLADNETLYFIRRPYEPLTRPISLRKLALDIVLFPFRLARAVVHFLNFFSLLVTRKPLLTAGGPPREGPDERYLMLWGRFIDAQKVLRAARNGEAQSLVPRTWQLVRRASDGREETLADAVLCYDLCPDGAIIYSDGSIIHHLAPSGERRQLCSAKLIQRAIALG